MTPPSKRAREQLTVEEMLGLARDLIDKRLVSTISREHQLARGVIDLLAEAQPCGMEDLRIQFTTEYGRVIVVPKFWTGVANPDDARHMARMLLRAADQCDAADAGKGE